MKRAFWLVVALATLIPGLANAQKVGTEWVWEPLRIVSTSVDGALDSQWPNSPNIQAAGFDYVDSAVVNKDGWSATVFDTSLAIDLSTLAYPPGLFDRGPLSRYAVQDLAGSGAGNAPADSAIFDTTKTTRWVAIRTSQDSTSFGWSSGAILVDSLVVMAEWSNDLVTWNGVTGTPTRTFIADHVVGGDEDVDYDALVANELYPGADIAQQSLECQPFIYNDGGAATALIINRTLCMAPGKYIRFIVRNGLAAYGQVHYEIGHWQ